MKCPECDINILEIPKRKPLPPSTTNTITHTSTMMFDTVSYSSTSQDYKCSNPKCWVTKVNLSWS